jgi:hypothetical protein
MCKTPLRRPAGVFIRCRRQAIDCGCKAGKIDYQQKYELTSPAHDKIPPCKKEFIGRFSRLWRGIATSTVLICLQQNLRYKTTDAKLKVNKKNSVFEADNGDVVFGRVVIERQDDHQKKPRSAKLRGLKLLRLPRIGVRSRQF